MLFLSCSVKAQVRSFIKAIHFIFHRSTKFGNLGWFLNFLFVNMPIIFIFISINNVWFLIHPITLYVWLLFARGLFGRCHYKVSSEQSRITQKSYEMKSIISKNANTFYFFGMSFIIRKNKLSGFANTNKRVPIAVAMAIRSLFSLW